MLFIFNINKIKFMIIAIMISTILMGCNGQSDFDKKMIDYRDSYKKIVNVLDADNLYTSIVNNNVMDEYERITEIYNYLITNSVEYKCKNTLVFQINHELLQDVIQNAQTYSDTSKGIYKIRIKMRLENLKNNIDIDIRNK